MADGGTTRSMSLVEILPGVRSLPRAEKLELLQILAQELAEAEAPADLGAGAMYPGWSLDPEFKAAEKLLEFLRAEERAAG
jgi:hypothetical protein